MSVWKWLLVCGISYASACCVQSKDSAWQAAVAGRTAQLGYRNWIVIAEASFPAHSRQGVHQVNAPVDSPEVLDYVLNSLEATQNVRPQIYLPRELRSVENDFAPGIDDYRKKVRTALHGHETIEIDQQSLLILLEDASKAFNVLVIRTATALPYSSIFLELQPGYWDADSETRLREHMQKEKLERLRSQTTKETHTRE